MSVWIGLRNSIGLAIPLALGAALGQTGGAVIVSLGALNVAFSDSYDPYSRRARRMLASCFIIAAAAFFGALSANFAPLAVLVAGLWAFGAGMLVPLGTAAAGIGVSSLATTLILAGHAAGFRQAALYALLAFCGGLLETGLALALWPVQRYRPERTVLGDLFLKLSHAAAAPLPAHEPPPATTQTSEAEEALAALGADHSVESERYRLLLSQAQRSRLCLVTLSRLRTRARREGREHAAESIDLFLGVSSKLLGCIGNLLRNGECDNAAECLAELNRILQQTPEAEPDIRLQMDALARQFRISVDLTRNATPAGIEAFAKRDDARPAKLRFHSVRSILRANLTLRSAAFRHAIRLAACVAAGDALARALPFQRSYWLPMTIAVILRPDFTSTFSRGIWRLLGTFAGLSLATLLFHFLPQNIWIEIALIAGGTFILRWAGPANYGLFVTTLSALIVLLAAIIGIAPETTIFARAVNTLAGGALALLAYWLWPTWERTRIADTMADLLDAYRRYFRDVTAAWFDPARANPVEADRARLAARLARSNMEASFDRLREEPGTPHRQVIAFSGMLASSHAFAHSAIALESSLRESPPNTPGDELRGFAGDVEQTLGVLAARLRGNAEAPPPNLREARRRLAKLTEQGSAMPPLLDIETDRITNSLNTLTEQVTRLARPL